MIPFKSIKEYWSAIVLVVFIIGGVVYWVYEDYMFNKLKKTGVKSVAFIYTNKPSGRSSACSANYYYYCDNQKYYWHKGTKDICDLDNKFCIVYYKKDNCKINSLDFNTIVPPDSVYKYFKGKANPFYKEIEQAKGFNFKEFLSPEIKR